ncbi:reactive intermediate deaminase [Gammaproteobacteria bacterium]|nr:reactive intermediate deaminase [Gammaproteobacteria bacterium]
MSIKRYEVGPRMSKIVVHNNTAYLCGVCVKGADIHEQTRNVLQEIERLLAEVGSDKTKILQAVIWLADINDFAAMNAIWDEWVPVDNAPARATGEVKLVTAEYKIEIIITAAI